MSGQTHHKKQETIRNTFKNPAPDSLVPSPSIFPPPSSEDLIRHDALRVPPAVAEALQGRMHLLGRRPGWGGGAVGPPAVVGVVFAGVEEEGRKEGRKGPETRIPLFIYPSQSKQVCRNLAESQQGSLSKQTMVADGTGEGVLH